MFEDGIEDREQLAHAGHQSHLLWFASRQEALVELPHRWVAACGDQSTHVKRCSDIGSATPPHHDGHERYPSHGLEEQPQPERRVACA